MKDMLESVAHVIDTIAVIVLVVGFFSVVVHNLPRALLAYKRHSQEILYDMFRHLRLQLGQVLLLALEILIVSDIVFSVLHRTIEEITILGLTVAIRIALSYFLNKELDHLEQGKSSQEE
ncbi:DUF1622 domain-containing protein [Rubritalea tangerina]|uniref:DUF1622 domain-containing protein n=1 Tax=Rubritalea tangerina TaxID=430798 RepID=A0ABW4ZE87_9BACT